MRPPSPPDMATLVERLRFALANPYAHNIVTLSKKTAEAILQHLERSDEHASNK